MSDVARVLVASGRIGEHSPVTASVAIARGLAATAAVAVVPLALGGLDLAEAVARIGGGHLHPEHPGWWVDLGDEVLIGWTQDQQGWGEADSADLGRWVKHVLAAHPAVSVTLDLTGLVAVDGGAGLLAEAADALAGRLQRAIVPADELDLAATGLQGVVARRGYAAGLGVAEVLAANAAMQSHADALGEGLATAAGGGAAGGAGLAVLHLGGRLLDGPQYCHFLARLEPTVAAADLVVTGGTQLSALDRGGPVIAAVAGWADQALKPCIALAGGPQLSRREVRTFGLEEMRALPDGVDAEGLATAAVRIGQSWFLPR